eukprot:scaffold6856_cov156-Amphora_coffeaeformis.AAC.7
MIVVCLVTPFEAGYVVTVFAMVGNTVAVVPIQWIENVICHHETHTKVSYPQPFGSFELYQVSRA